MNAHRVRVACRPLLLPTLAACAALAAPVACAAAAEAPAGRPNILFIMTDQHTSGALGCAGNPHVKTPNLDRLAARGVRFTRSYVANPLCVPSRASIFSSRTPHALAIYGNTMDAELHRKGVPTMGELFQAAGYETAYAGKWHVHAAFPAYMGRQIPGFTVLPLGGSDPRQGDKRTEQKSPQCDPHIAAAAIQFLHQPHRQPFLLTVSLLNPHDICEFGRYEGFRKPQLPTDESVLPPAPRNLRDSAPLPSALDDDLAEHAERTELEWRQYLWVYHRLVESSDQLIGRILDALDQAGLASSTIVVFTSDHGDMLGAHGMVSKQKLYEESVAVPLVIAAPGTTPAVDQRHLVGGIDILPTFLDYAGIAAPESLEGRSLKPLVEGRPTAWREWIAAETFGPEARMIRTDRYKYIAFAAGQRREQFFDEAQDPGELRNLVADPAVAAELERHRRLLAEWMQATDDMPGKGTRELEFVKRREQGRGRAKADAE